MLASDERKGLARRVVKRLRAEYPDARCALAYGNPLELLVATILSAQCTDVRVNQVTPALFERYRTAAEFAAAKPTELERLIQSTGFFRNKAKNIRACCEAISTRFGGEVPQDLASLVELPGIGRKTANVVLGTGFGLATGVVVDTHVTRLSRRLGLTEHRDAVKIERDLMELLPRRDWVDFSHLLIHHGRQVCKARNPRCDDCVLRRWCPRIGVEPKRGRTARTKSR